MTSFAEQAENKAAMEAGVLRINALIAATKAGSDKALASIATNVHREIEESISHEGDGRSYFRHGIEHIASSPGNPPATDIGLYKNSWWVEFGIGVAAVGTSSPVGPWMEYGTRDIAPRPHVRPAVERQEALMTAEFIAAVVAAQAEALAAMGAVPGA